MVTRDAPPITLADLPFIPDKYFVSRVAALLEQLRLESERRGHRALASLLGNTRLKAEGELKNRGQRPKISPALSRHELPLADEDSVLHLASQLACRPNGPHRQLRCTPTLRSDGAEADDPKESNISREENRLRRIVHEINDDIARAACADHAHLRPKLNDAGGHSLRSATADSKLRLRVGIRHFDIDRLSFSLNVGDEANPEGASEGLLKMTLSEMDMFLNAFRAAMDEIEIISEDRPTINRPLKAERK